MSVPPLSVNPLFAVPFISALLPGAQALNPALLALFGARATEAYRDGQLKPDPLCFRSREDLFDWPEPAAANLRGEVLGAVCQAVMAASTLTEAEFDGLAVQARARFVVVRPNGALPAASVPLASWCALYCVAVPAPHPSRADSAAVRLYETRLASMFLDASNSQLRPPFTPGHQVWHPVPGEIAVFPASIMHEVALNRGDRDLVLVAARLRFAHPRMEALPPW
ncbi:MAG: hypothetical protein ACHP9U_02870 [Steroidobacterales bacterium]